MPSLPSELVEDILCRLPVKPLKRFRCVAKSWCSLIDGDRFIKSHWKKSLETNSHRHLIVGGCKNVFTIDLDEDPIKASVTKVPFAQDFAISNSCNGLFLVFTNPLTMIWNPFTKEHKVLPGVHDVYPPPMGCFMKIVYGFAYDSRNDDYKIVRVVEHRELTFQTWMSSRAHIYSLKSDSWKQIESFTYPVPYLREHWHTDVNGALHTLIEYTPPLEPGPHKIMAFSVESERHYEVKLPPGIAERKDMYLSLNKIGGCLAVNCATESGIVIWVMKDYGISESWKKIFSIDIRLNMDDPDDCESMKPLVYSKDGQRILIYLGYDTFFWHGENSVENVPLNGLPNILDYVEPCVESLVSVRSRQVQKQVIDHAKKEEKKIKKKRDNFLSKGFKLVL